MREVLLSAFFELQKLMRLSLERIVPACRQSRQVFL
jgi:hypothetical protein